MIDKVAKNYSLASIKILEESLKESGVDINKKTSIGNTIILLDCSGSMAGEKLEQAKKGIKGFILDAKEKGYLIGLIIFGSFAKIITEVTPNYNKIVDKLNGLELLGCTNLAEAIRLSKDLFNNTLSNKALVIVTDGMPDDAEEALLEANIIKNNGIEIITIGTDDANLDFLKMIATKNELAIPVEKENLAKAIRNIAGLLQ